MSVPPSATLVRMFCALYQSLIVPSAGVNLFPTFAVLDELIPTKLPVPVLNSN